MAVTVRPSSLDSPGWPGGVTVTTAAQLPAASNVVSYNQIARWFGIAHTKVAGAGAITNVFLSLSI
jgi:hypothetical protein